MVTTAERIRDVLSRLLLEGVGRRDRFSYLNDTYHDDVVIHESPALPYGGTFRGLDGVLRHARGYLEAWGGLQEAEHRDLRSEILVGDNEALVRWQLRAADAGRSETFPVVSHYRFRDDLIIESRMFHFDDAAVVAFLSRSTSRDASPQRP